MAWRLSTSMSTLDDARVFTNVDQVKVKDRLLRHSDLLRYYHHKRVYRVYSRLGLNLPRRTKRVLPKRSLAPLQVVVRPNHQRALDFMHDTLYCTKRFRVLNVIDEGARECLAIEADTSLPAPLLVRVMEQLKGDRGLPKQIPRG